MDSFPLHTAKTPVVIWLSQSQLNSFQVSYSSTLCSYTNNGKIVKYLTLCQSFDSLQCQTISTENVLNELNEPNNLYKQLVAAVP